MKLRLKENSIRLRLNQSEVSALAAGSRLEHHVRFPGNTQLSYVLEAAATADPSVNFDGGTIRIGPSQHTVTMWSAGDEVGLYFDLPVSGSKLHVAIEKDLECIDGPPGEYDPDAFPRDIRRSC